MTAYATVKDWARFLQPVAAAVRNPPSPDDFKGRCGALAFALRVPASALTEDRARELCRTSTFWPSVEDVEKLFAEVWKEQARSRAIANSGGAQILLPSQRLNRAPEEIEAVRAKVAEFIAERRFEADKPKARACHLSTADLRAAYAAAKSPAARFRAAQLQQEDGE